MHNGHEPRHNLTIQAVAERHLTPIIIRIKPQSAKLLLKLPLSEAVLLSDLSEELSWM